MVVMPPLECPLAPMRSLVDEAGDGRSGSADDSIIASTRKLTSPVWCCTSAPSAPAGLSGRDSGNLGATTTKPADTQRSSTGWENSGVPPSPWEKTISGNGP